MTLRDVVATATRPPLRTVCTTILSSHAAPHGTVQGMLLSYPDGSWASGARYIHRTGDVCIHYGPWEQPGEAEAVAHATAWARRHADSLYAEAAAMGRARSVPTMDSAR